MAVIREPSQSTRDRTEVVPENLSEYVGGAASDIHGVASKGVVVPQNDDLVVPQDKMKTTDEVKLPDGRVGLRQPLATRHLDPNEAGVVAEGTDPYLAEGEDRKRYKVRGGYHFLYGSKLSYKGPCYLWLTDEEVAGQELKLELVGADPVRMKKGSPERVLPAAQEGENANNIRKRLMSTLGEAEILKAELFIADAAEKTALDRARGDDGARVDASVANPTEHGVPIADVRREELKNEKQQAIETENAEASEHVPAHDAAAIEGDKPRGRGRPPGSTDKKPRKPRTGPKKVQLAGGENVDASGGANPVDEAEANEE
jgi:hypothetical protein